MTEINLFSFIILIFIFLNFYVESGLGQRCGRSDNSTRIIGGKNTNRLEWPWMALLKITFQGRTTSRISQCGGSLISEEWVLTAAHCVNSPSGYRLIRVEVTLGEHDVTRTEGTEIKTLGSQVLMNNFNPSTVGNDIALIKLRRKLDFKGRQQYLQPICLPSNGLTSDFSRCYATGWGTTSVGGKSANILQEVRLPVLENSVCRRFWSNSFRPEYQICAGNLEGGHDTCQGDSGGPLNCQLPNGVWVQQGITSFGAGCAKPRSPGVYTRVAAYVEWIQSVTNIN